MTTKTKNTVVILIVWAVCMGSLFAVPKLVGRYKRMITNRQMWVDYARRMEYEARYNELTGNLQKSIDYYNVGLIRLSEGTDYYLVGEGHEDQEIDLSEKGRILHVPHM